MQALSILFGAAFTAAVALALGALLLRDACRDQGVRFVTGAGILSLAVFCISSAGLAYPLVFAIVGAAALLPFRRHVRLSGLSLKHNSLNLGHNRSNLNRVLLFVFAAYFILYFFNAMAPEASPDGAAYHLGLVSRYLRDHGFRRITDNFYAAFPAGVEMLYLFAFAFGKHSAAAMVHFAFLVALVWQMFAWGRRAGLGIAGACGALLVAASPMVGVDGTSAYNDVAVAAIAFTLFHLLQMWRDHPNPRLLAAAGLVAGFAFAAKYTAWPAIPYALIFVLWQKPRSVMRMTIVAGCAAIAIAPWLLKNCIYLHNPVAPFYNRLFPNPFVLVSFEDTYRRMLSLYELKTRWQIPMQVTTYGSLSGLLGPVFLLSPVGLSALRHREGRHLLLAALVFGASYFSNIGTRFLIPVLPFAALAMALALARVPHLLLAIALVHAVISWPSVVPKYSRPEAWRLLKVPWREALRVKSEDAYLESHLANYGVGRMIERAAAPGSTIFTFTPIPEAYTSRRIRVAFQSAQNKISGDTLRMAIVPEYAPTWRLRFAYPRQALRGVRVVQTNSGEDLWNIHELRILDGDRELLRNPRWRLRAHPYPWGIQDAFDNTLSTFWLCGETLHPGQFVQVDFNGSETADSVLIETAPNQAGVRLKLEGRDAGGEWQLLAPSPSISDAARPLGLRLAVAGELKRRGNDYLLVFDQEMGAGDLWLNAHLWGIRQVGEYKGARLYQLP